MLAPLLIILKACCFISCYCQISAIYIPQLRHGGEWLLIFFFLSLPKMNGSGSSELKAKSGEEGGGVGEIEDSSGGKLQECKSDFKVEARESIRPSTR